MSDNPPIDVTPTPDPDQQDAIVVPDAGVPDGTVLDSHESGSIVREQVVYDTDADGTVVGWHKEEIGQ